MHSAGNCYGAWLDHHRISSGTDETDHGMTFCMSGTSGKNNSWNAMDSTCGRTDISRNTKYLHIISLSCQETGGSNVG